MEDLVEGILKAIGTEKSIGETYYLTDGQSYAWRELLLTLKQEVLAGSWYIPIPEQPDRAGGCAHRPAQTFRFDPVLFRTQSLENHGDHSLAFFIR